MRNIKNMAIKKTNYLSSFILLILIFTEIIIYCHLNHIYSNGWTGPGIEISKKSFISQINDEIEKNFNSYNNYIYDDFTIFALKEKNFSYPVTYFFKDTELNENIVSQNIGEQVFLGIFLVGLEDQIKKKLKSINNDSILIEKYQEMTFHIKKKTYKIGFYKIYQK